MPVLTIGIVRDCFYLHIFYSEKFSTLVCRLPFAVNVNLNLSNATLNFSVIVAAFPPDHQRPAEQSVRRIL